MLEQQQCHPLLELLREEGAVTEELVANLLSWHHNALQALRNVASMTPEQAAEQLMGKKRRRGIR